MICAEKFGYIRIISYFCSIKIYKTMILRENYLNQIRPFINQPIVKVITGIRRSGKSELLKMVRQELLQSEIAPEQIIYINFESMQWDAYRNAAALYAYLDEQKKRLSSRLYILLDEIQEVQGWERVINSILSEWDSDIYITGSNSHLLSSELSTYIAGRYVEFSVYPLSFREFLTFHSTEATDKQWLSQAFEQYLRQGGFPVVHIHPYSTEEIYKVVSDIYASILLRDTIQRYAIRNVDLLERLVGFLFDNIGNPFSAKSVSDYLKSQQRKCDYETIYNYLQALQSSFIIHRVPRYDIKGKEILATQEKYYVTDLSLIYARQGFRPEQIAGLLENLVYLELIRQNFAVYIGKQNTYEVDFIAQKQDKCIYIQVCYRFDSQETLSRELRPLQAIKDNYPKYIVTTDNLYTGSFDGVQCVQISDFLQIDL